MTAPLTAPLTVILRADPGFAYHKLISGTIIALALLTALSGSALTEWHAMGTLLAGAVSDAFSRGLAAELATGQRTRPGEALALLRKSALMLIPGTIPVLAFAAVAANALSLDRAFAGACWLLVPALFVAGAAAARTSGCGPLRAGVYGLMISAFGLGIVALQLLPR